MSRWRCLSLSALALATLACALFFGPARARQATGKQSAPNDRTADVPVVASRSKAPVNRYGLALTYRKADQAEVNRDQKYTLECFQEQETGNGIYVSNTGALSVLSKGLFKEVAGKDRGALSQHGFVISVRPADSKARTPKFGVECFLDENSNNLIYLTQAGSISVVPGKYATPTKGKVKGYSLTHGVILRVRKAGESDWDKPTTRKYGIDVFEDENNGNVIYLSETGSVCVLPSATAGRSSGENEKPEWQYGLDLRVRSASEVEFTGDSKAFGVEVFKDAHNGCMLYVVENGNVAVVPSKLARFRQGKPKGPELKRGFSLGVRGVEESTFTDRTKKTGVEVYLDQSSGNLIYFSESGQMAVVPGKEE